MVTGKSKAAKVKSKSKIKSKTESEFECKSESCHKEDMFSEINNLVNKMMKRKHFTKRGVKMKLQNKDQPNEVNIQCFKCNKKRILQIRMSSIGGIGERLQSEEIKE